MTRYAMVIDLNTCVACNACMAACAMENQTPVWKNQWRTWVHDKEIGTGEDITRRFFPRLCNHGYGRVLARLLRGRGKSPARTR